MVLWNCAQKGHCRSENSIIVTGAFLFPRIRSSLATAISALAAGAVLSLLAEGVGVGVGLLLLSLLTAAALLSLFADAESVFLKPPVLIITIPIKDMAAMPTAKPKKKLFFSLVMRLLNRAYLKEGKARYFKLNIIIILIMRFCFLDVKRVFCKSRFKKIIKKPFPLFIQGRERLTEQNHYLRNINF
jgi:hypothetical protein